MLINWFIAFFRLLVPLHTKSAQSYKEILTYAREKRKNRKKIAEIRKKKEKSDPEGSLPTNR